MQEYQALLAAVKELEKAKSALTLEEGMFISPAYRMLAQAQRHIGQQMENLLRSEA